MTATPLTDGTDGRWRCPIDLRRYDRSPVLFAAEQRAIGELGLRNLRRLRHHDPDAPQWAEIGRLLRPLHDVNASFDTPPSMHARRAMHDAVAVLLLRCAEAGPGLLELG
jgi:Tat protein secretion system quality control protein TatD with DNase activity